MVVRVPVEDAAERGDRVEQVVDVDVDDVALDTVVGQFGLDVAVPEVGQERRGQVPQEHDPVGAVLDGRFDDAVELDAERRDVDVLGNRESHRYVRVSRSA